MKGAAMAAHLLQNTFPPDNESLESKTGLYQLLESWVTAAVSRSVQRPRVSKPGERHTEVEHMDTFTIKIGLWLGLKM